MTIWNLGSINIDLVYDVPHLPGAGETLAAGSMTRGLGGKGANMSVAAARAAGRVAHIGAVGADGRWAAELMLEYGVDTRFIARVDAPTGHAVIAVEPSGENLIMILGGANRAVPEDLIGRALSEASAGDIFLTQNETNGQARAVRMARDLGLKVTYAAAPFDALAVQEVLPMLDLLVLNEVEASQLEAATGLDPKTLPVADVIVTLGARGCRWYGADGVRDYPALPVAPVDTTGAGDTFTGYVVAGLDQGLPMPQAIAQALRAAAIMVTRHGTADVIPDLKDVQDARF
ncbi:MAG: ribokinase [Rhodobacteraceae bacterium]|nr:ribokinase [Paracoccaceae bacterium]